MVVVCLAAAGTQADEAVPGGGPAYDCLLGGADTARVAADGTVTLTRRGEPVAAGRAALGFPFRAEAGGVACTADHLTVFAVSPDGASHALLHLRVEGAALVVTEGAPASPISAQDGRALCRAGRHGEGAALLRAEAQAGPPDAWLALGDCLWDGGMKGEAREAWLVYARHTPRRQWPSALSRRCPECEPPAR